MIPFIGRYIIITIKVVNIFDFKGGTLNIWNTM